MEKKYWSDAYLTEFDTIVVEVVENGFVLEETLFYPEGGNQDSDIGTLTIKEKTFEITDVQEKDGKIIHYVRIPLTTGDKELVNQSVYGNIDWNHRYALMKAHTAQHLFSAFMFKEFGIYSKNISIHPDEFVIEFDKETTNMELTYTLQFMNSVTISKGLVKNLSNLILDEENANEKYGDIVRGPIPKQKTVRLVKIGDLDLSSCGGTHVKSTSEIGVVFIYKFNRGTEIRVFVGDKGITAFRNANSDLLRLSTLLKAPLNEVYNLTEKIYNNAETLKISQKQMENHFLLGLGNFSGDKIGDHTLNLLNFEISRKTINKTFDQFPKNSIFVINPETDRSRILIYSNSEKITSKMIFEKICSYYGGKGGGSQNNYQGKLDKIPHRLKDKIVDFINKVNN